MPRLITRFLAGCSVLGLVAAAQAQDLPQAGDSYFKAAQAALQEQLAKQPINGKAKNIILFIGDGMSVPTITAARILDGQMRNVDGESNVLPVDRFPYVALSKTYSNDGQVSDSAPTATAMVTGVKLKNTHSGAVTERAADGVFIAIGHAPATQLFKGQLETNHSGYLVTRPDSTATATPGVYAAGDVKDEVYRQAVTAAAMGCMAALEAERYFATLEIEAESEAAE